MAIVSAKFPGFLRSVFRKPSLAGATMVLCGAFAAVAVAEDLTDGSTLAFARGLSAAATPSAETARGSSHLFTGAATFTFPIDVAPGVRGMQPQLALSYSSLEVGSDSWVGAGWSLTLGSIARSLREGVPAFDNAQDTFVLNGQELVWADGKWRTRQESFLDIRFSGSPPVWEVRSKDGTVSRYGTRDGSVTSNCSIDHPDSSLQSPKFAWLLCEREDVHGNKMRVYYDHSDTGTAYIDRIEYGTGAELNRSVEFNLESRPDPTLKYSAGFAQTMTQRLGSIDVKAGGELIRHYELVHLDPSLDSGRSLLREIWEYGSDAADPSPTPPLKTQFDYHSNVSAGTQGWEIDPSWTWPAGVNLVLESPKSTDGGTRIADLDGDGLPDLLREMRASSSSADNDALSGFYRNSGTGFEPRTDAFRLPMNPYSQRHSFAVRTGSDESVALGTMLTDLNRDGRADMLFMHGSRGNHDVGGSVYVTQHHRVHNTEGGWVVAYQDYSSTESWLPPFGELSGFHVSSDLGICISYYGGCWYWGDSGRTSLAELNGDGRPDFMTRDYYLGYGFYADKSYSLNTGDVGTGFTSALSDSYQGCTDGSQSCAIESTSVGRENTAWLFFQTLSLGKRHIDVNGDGLDDYVMGYQREASEEVPQTDWRGTWLNDGRDYVRDDAWNVPVFFDVQEWATKDQGVRFADVNGDGRVDLVQAVEGLPHGVWLNKGHPNAGNGTSTWEPLNVGSPWQMPSGLDFSDAAGGRDLGLRLVDLNGDGMVDLVHAQKAQPILVYLNRGARADTLTQVTNRFGGTTSFEYGSSTSEYLADADPSDWKLPHAVQVVKRIVSDDLRGDLVVTEFAYEGGQYDSQKREFRGFRKVSTAVRQGLAGPVLRKTDTYFHQDEPRLGLVSANEVRDAAGVLWSRTEREYTADPESAAPWVSLPTKVRKLEYDGFTTPRRTLVVTQYDLTYGNPTSTIEYGEVDGADADIDPLDSRVTTLTYAMPNNPLYIVDRVASHIVRAGANPQAGAILRESYLHYDDQALGAMPSLGLLTKRVDNGGPGTDDDPIVTFDYDEYGNRTKVTSPRASALEFSASQGVTTTVYDATFHAFPISITNGLGHEGRTEYATDDYCATLAAQWPELQIEPNYPEGAGLVAVERGPNDLAQSPQGGIVTCYDVFGRVTRQDRPGLVQKGWAYDDTPGAVNVHQWTMTDISSVGTLSRVDFDGNGRAHLQRTDGPQGKFVWTQTHFDALGRRVRESDPYFSEETPRFTESDYDVLGRVTETRLPGTIAGGGGGIPLIPGAHRVYTVEYEHALVGNTVQVFTKTTDPNDGVVRRRLDAFGRIVEVREEGIPGQGLPGGPYVTKYVYDEMSQLVEVRDQHNNVTTIGWDELGRKTSIVDPDTGVTTYEYDVAGNVKEQASALGTLFKTYDPLERPKTVRVEGWGQDSVVWTYDVASGGLGRLAKVVDHLAGHTHTIDQYDALGQITDETFKTDNVSHTFVTTYDGLGQIKTRTYPGSNGPGSPNPRTVTWVHDDRGHLTRIEGEGVVYADNIEWDAQGSLSRWTAGNGVVTENVMDPVTGRLDRVRTTDPAEGLIQSLGYQYDNGDRITELSDDLDWFATRNFGYDALDRLSASTDFVFIGPVPPGSPPPGWKYYEYDPIGNMTCRASSSPDCEPGAQVPLGASQPAYLAYPEPQGAPGAIRPHAPLTVNGEQVSYDSAGNVTGFGSRTYEYDPLGRLVSAADNGTVLRRFQYDVGGRLSHMYTSPQAADAVNRYLITPDFEWDELDERGRIHIMLGSHRIATHAVDYRPPNPPGCGFAPSGMTRFNPTWLWMFGLGIVLILRRRIHRFITSLCEQLAGLELHPGTAICSVAAVALGILAVVPHGWGASGAAADAETVEYYHSDHLGSTIVMTDSAGSVARKIYRPYGEIMLGNFAQQGDPLAVPEFGFNGQRFVEALGIYDYGARWYDPALGRFLQPDSIIPEPGDPQSLNRYSYARNNPLGRIDPSGHQDVPATSAQSAADSKRDEFSPENFNPETGATDATPAEGDVQTQQNFEDYADRVGAEEGLNAQLAFLDSVDAGDLPSDYYNDASQHSRRENGSLCSTRCQRVRLLDEQVSIGRELEQTQAQQRFWESIDPTHGNFRSTVGVSGGVAGFGGTARGRVELRFGAQDGRQANALHYSYSAGARSSEGSSIPKISVGARWDPSSADVRRKGLSAGPASIDFLLGRDGSFYGFRLSAGSSAPTATITEEVYSGKVNLGNFPTF